MKNIFCGKNRKRNITVYLILLSLWLSFIFSNSLADGERSSQQSGMVVDFVQGIAEVFDSDAVVDSGAIRTAAHFTEFFVLGALYYVGSFFIKSSRVSLFFHSLSASLFTAFADETVQLFVNGRGADVKDVWTDFSGALVAHIIVFAIYYSYKYSKNRL